MNAASPIRRALAGLALRRAFSRVDAVVRETRLSPTLEPERIEFVVRERAFRNVRYKVGKPATEEFRERLQDCKTADEVHALHQELLNAAQHPSPRTRRRWVDMALARIVEIDRTAAA